MMNITSNFTSSYFYMFHDLVNNYEFISSPRGSKIKEILSYSFTITNPLDRLPNIPERKFSLYYVIAEMLWYLSGSNETKWISYYAPFWNSISDDGVTANSAYGARIFKQNDTILDTSDWNSEWNQWDYVINELVSDNDSRRAVIHIRVPADSAYAKKDVPCTLSLQFFLREDKLHMTVTMRSSDVVLGIAYDIPAFTLFQELMALQLSEKLNKKILLGNYHHTSNSFHLYEKHFKMADEIASSSFSLIKSFGPMPVMTSLPKLDILMKAEKQIRESTDTLYIHAYIKKAIEAGLDDYWSDWLVILGCHRIEKIFANDPNASKRMLYSSEFANCYIKNKYYLNFFRNDNESKI